ncbi:MAG: polysaccharide deacetylase family protein [Bacteroidota bacterium]
MSILNRTLGPVLFPSILWHSTEQSVHMTFDDGPHPVATPKVLDILRKRDIKATFFLIGTHVAQYPELVQQIMREGHSIGNHTYSHPMLFLKPKKLQATQIEKTDNLIAHLVGTRPPYFRPPYGYFDHNTMKVAQESNHKFVMWDVDSRDFDTHPISAIAERVGKQATHGSIILFHDNHSTEQKIDSLLDRILDQLEERGFTFSPLPA